MARSGSRASSGSCVTALAVASLLTPAGCGRTVTEEDCRAVAENLHAAWRDETKDIAAEDRPTKEKASGVIRAEGEKLVADWSSECRSTFVGQKVDAKEMQCLLGAKTLADLRKCSRQN